jgi:hypothetical protein
VNKGLQGIKIMNMSASILRNIVSSVFNIKPTSVILSDEIAPDKKWESNSCWSSQTTCKSYEVWGFKPQNGFVSLSEEIVGHYYNHSDGSASIKKATKLCDLQGVEEYLFFLMHEDIRAYDENKNEDNWVLYKAPNFKEHWAKIETKDIKRWEKWLAE